MLTVPNIKRFIYLRNHSTSDSNLQFITDCGSSGIYVGELGLPTQISQKVTQWNTQLGLIVEDMSKQFGDRYYFVKKMN